MKHPPKPFRLMDFSFDPDSGTLESPAGVERLPPRLTTLLCLLVEEANQTVERDLLVAALWPRGFVNEDALSRAIAELRRFLGDDARSPQFIETVPKRGYRLIAPVEWLDDSSSEKGRFTPMRLTTLLIIVTVLVTVIVFQTSRGPEFAVNPALMATAARLTADPVMKHHPQISPDGELLAYLQQLDGRLTLILLPTAQPTERREIKHPDPVQSPVFAPDSTRMAIAMITEAGCIVHQWTVNGENPTPLAPCAIPNESPILDWSADDRYIAYVDIDSSTGGAAIWEYSLADATRTQLTVPPDGYSFDTRPRYSPNGQWLSFSRGTRAAREIWVLDLKAMRDDDTAPVEAQQLSFDHQFTISHQWMPDNHTIVLDSERSGYRALWSLNLEGEWNLLGARDAESPSLANHRLAFKVSQFESNIWSVDLHTGLPSDQPLLESNKYDSNPAWSPDYQEIAFTSNRTGRGAIWIASADGSNQRLVYEPGSGRVVAPAWSPDGRHLLTTQYQTGGQTLVKIDLEEQQATPVMTAGQRPYSGMYSADGQWLYYIAKAGIEGNRLWRQPVDGSAEGEIVVPQPVNSYRLVPDQGVFYTKYGQEGLYRTSIEDPENETLVIDDLVVSSWGDWLVADQWIFYLVEDDQGRTALMKTPLEGGDAEWVSDYFPTSMWPNLAINLKTNTMLVSRTDRAQSDLFLVELDP